MKKDLLFKIILFIMLAGIIIVFAISPSKDYSVSIFPGTTAREAASILKEAEVISSSADFLLTLAVKNAEHLIKPGKYIFNSRMSYSEIIDKLIKGESIKITIPEGYTAKQIADLLFNKGFISNKDKFLLLVEKQGVEGFLFPATYEMLPGYSEEKIIQMMVNEFRKHFTLDMEKRANELNMTKKEIVILASIIEKEARLKKEMPLISSVFYNRLKIGKPLESCATVLYALDTHKNRLSYSDLKTDSPYNTYIYRGLPPGPICNPGINALIAALYPADTQYLYFVSRGDGSHCFSKTYQEHLKAQQR